MTLSADLITRYSTETDVDWRHAFIFSHPEATTKYIIGHTGEFEGLVDGFVQIFQPVPVEIVPTSRDAEGREEMQLVFGGIGLEAKGFLDEAIADGSEPVTMRYSIFILGDQDPQIDPWYEFHLASVSIKTDQVAVTASRADIINRPFPTEVYRVASAPAFPGLRRR